MDMDWLESFIFGLVSGVTEILPVSSQAHESLVMKLFGMADFPLLRLLVHTAVWEALYLSLRHSLDRMFQEHELAKLPPNWRDRQPDLVSAFDLRLVRSALIPMMLGFVVYYFLRGWRMDLSKVALLLLVNGVILYIPRWLRSGNKDSRSMTGLDGLLMGFAGALGALPGVSRLGAVASTAIGRGADREHGLRWAMVLALGGLLGVIGFDAWELLTTGLGGFTFPMLLASFLAVTGAFLGATVAIRAMRFLAVRTGFSGFAYYSWGAALFAFLMYLTI